MATEANNDHEQVLGKRARAPGDEGREEREEEQSPRASSSSSSSDEKKDENIWHKWRKFLDNPLRIRLFEALR